MVAIGRRVQQLFGDTYHYGIVDSYDVKVKWFLVKFEDGDQQEYELEPLLLKVPVSEPSEDPGAASDDEAPLSALVSKWTAPTNPLFPCALQLQLSE